MKKYFYIIVVIFICSCSFPSLSSTTCEMVYDGIPTVEDADEAWMLTTMLDYIPETGFGDEWLDPRTTIAEGGGDCEDIASLFVALVRKTGIPAYIVTYRPKNSSNRHAIVWCSSLGYIEPQCWGARVEEPEYFEIITLEKYLQQCDR